MREEITYYAEDGTKFTDKQECLDYENKLNIVKSWTMEDINKIYKTLALIKEYCKHCSDCSRSCPFECICEECVDSWKIPNTQEDIKKVETEIKDFEAAFKEVTAPSYWIQVESDKDENDFYCSNCGHRHHGSDISKYCDFCGSNMEDGCVTIPICSCYDKSERCNGTRERDWVTCKGDRMNCKIYDNVIEKALKEANDVHYERQRNKHHSENIPYVINTENQCIYEVTYLSPSKTKLDILPNQGEESLYICKNTPLVHPYIPLTLDKIELYNIDIVLKCDKQETVKRILKYFDLVPTSSGLTVSIENGKVKECSKGTIYTNFPRFDVSINEKNELEFTYAFSCK